MTEEAFYNTLMTVLLATDSTQEQIIGAAKRMRQHHEITNAERKKVEDMYAIVVSNLRTSLQVRKALEQENQSLRNQIHLLRERQV